MRASTCPVKILCKVTIYWYDIMHEILCKYVDKDNNSCIILWYYRRKICIIPIQTVCRTDILQHWMWKYFFRFMVIFCLFVEAVKSSKHIGLRIPLLQSYALKLVYLLDSECPYDVFSQWFSFYQGHLNVSINLRLIGPVTHTLHLEHTINTYKVNLNMFYRAVVTMKWALTKWDEAEIKIINKDDKIND